MNENQSGSKRSEREGASGTTPGLSDDQLYRALASTQRRRLLYLLRDDAERTVEQIATALAGWDAAETGKMATPDDHDRLVVALEHTHLPLLAETGLITYDRASGAVRIEPLDDAVSTVLRQSVEAERSSRS